MIDVDRIVECPSQNPSEMKRDEIQSHSKFRTIIILINLPAESPRIELNHRFA